MKRWCVAPAAHNPRMRARQVGLSLSRAQCRNPLPASWLGPVSLTTAAHLAWLFADVPKGAERRRQEESRRVGRPLRWRMPRPCWPSHSLCCCAHAPIGICVHAPRHQAVTVLGPLCYKCHMRTEPRSVVRPPSRKTGTLWCSIFNMHSRHTAMRWQAKAPPQSQSCGPARTGLQPRCTTSTCTPLSRSARTQCNSCRRLLPLRRPPQARRAQPSREKAASTINLVAFPL